ncbi:hypothetical protein BaRGS_00039513, partial [Batillaria attramentaria]
MRKFLTLPIDVHRHGPGQDEDGIVRHCVCRGSSSGRFIMAGQDHHYPGKRDTGEGGCRAILIVQEGPLTPEWHLDSPAPHPAYAESGPHFQRALSMFTELYREQITFRSSYPP